MRQHALSRFRAGTHVGGPLDALVEVALNEGDERAVFKGSLFLDTDAGADAYRTIKAMGDLMEYSWGFRILDADFVERDAEYIRVIKRAELFEVSPVLVGAGIGTGTLSLKHGLPLYDHGDAVLEAVRDFVSRVEVRTDYRAKEGRTLSSANRERLQAIADALSGAAGDLKAILKDKKELFARCLAEKMLTYALGRGVEFYDGPALDRIVAALARHDYKFSTLVTEIVKSEPFRLRRGKELSK